MRTSPLPTASARLNPRSAASGTLGLHTRSEEGRKVRQAAQDACCHWQDRAEVFLVQAFLPELESARSPGERQRLFRLLTQSSSPVAIIERAFHEYDQTGREAFILHAVSLLETFGERAWPALLRVAASGRPETELFLGLIARCQQVSADERSAAFRLLSKHAPPSVRIALLEHLASLGPEREQGILRAIAESDPDETVRTEADVRLSVLNGSDF